MTYKNVRVLERGIEVLRYLNKVKGAAPSEIAENVNLPRPTVHRILETLSSIGLIYHSQTGNEYRVGSGVWQLTGSSSNTGVNWIDEIALPSLRDLTAEVIWPSDIAVCDGSGMIIQASTHRISPMSCDVGMVGKRRSMLLSPLGRAYLSHSSDEEVERILRTLRNSTALEDKQARDDVLVAEIIEAGRRDEISVCLDQPHPRCASLAAPIRQNGYVIACMNVIWRANMMTIKDAMRTLRAPLLAVRDRIECQLRDWADPASSRMNAEAVPHSSRECQPSVLPAEWACSPWPRLEAADAKSALLSASQASFPSTTA